MHSAFCQGNSLERGRAQADLKEKRLKVTDRGTYTQVTKVIISYNFDYLGVRPSISDLEPLFLKTVRWTWDAMFRSSAPLRIDHDSLFLIARLCDSQEGSLVFPARSVSRSGFLYRRSAALVFGTVTYILVGSSLLVALSYTPERMSLNATISSFITLKVGIHSGALYSKNMNYV